MKNRIKYSDLSGWLQVMVIYGWINIGLMGVYFMVGFLGAI